VRFLSIEPLLGPIPALPLDGIDWVIVGGESGPRHRPIDPAWVRDLREQCVTAGVAFFLSNGAARFPSRTGGCWMVAPGMNSPSPARRTTIARSPKSGRRDRRRGVAANTRMSGWYSRVKISALSALASGARPVERSDVAGRLSFMGRGRLSILRRLQVGRTARAQRGKRVGGVRADTPKPDTAARTPSVILAIGCQKCATSRS
jgi:hypothetical protein